MMFMTTLVPVGELASTPPSGWRIRGLADNESAERPTHHDPPSNEQRGNCKREKRRKIYARAIGESNEFVAVKRCLTPRV